MNLNLKFIQEHVTEKYYHYLYRNHVGTFICETKNNKQPDIPFNTCWLFKDVTIIRGGNIAWPYTFFYLCGYEGWKFLGAGSSTFGYAEDIDLIVNIKGHLK